MTLTPSTIKPAFGARRTSKRLGRGNGSQKGTTGGRGGKGQTARSGGGSRTQIRAFRHQLLKVPKLRGFKSHHPKNEVVTLHTLEVLFKDGEQVTLDLLKKRGAIGTTSTGVKILASGELTKKLTIIDCLATKKAVEMIEKSGSTVKF